MHTQTWHRSHTRRRRVSWTCAECGEAISAPTVDGLAAHPCFYMFTHAELAEAIANPRFECAACGATVEPGQAGLLQHVCTEAAQQALTKAAAS